MKNQELLQRKVGRHLSAGILFMPYIFSWIILRHGYTNKARWLSFTWMLIVLLIVGGNATKNDRRSAEQAATSPAKKVVNGTRQRSQMSSGQVADMCTKLAMYAMSYGNSKYHQQGPGRIFENVAEEINGYPSDMREPIRNTWSKLVGMVNRTSPQELRVYTRSDSAISLSSRCQSVWNQSGPVN